MRKFFFLSLVTGLIGCASQERGVRPSFDDLGDPAVVTYYDRNHDGIVDYEFHNFGCCDRNWGLIDTDFNGRYDLKLRWGYSFERMPVDAPVPSDVHVSSDAPNIGPL